MVHRQTGRTGAMTENWWMGRMDQMVEAAAVSRTDYVLIGHFEALESFQVESQAPQTVNAEELEAYRTAYEPYLSQVRVYLYAISDERAEHQRLGRTGARGLGGERVPNIHGGPKEIGVPGGIAAGHFARR